MRFKRYSLAVLVAAVSLGLTVPATADSDVPSTSLVVTNDGMTVTLTCDPPGGTHPWPKTACRELDANNGNVTQIASSWDTGPCRANFPVELSAQGTWRGKPVDFAKVFTWGGCQGGMKNSPLFDFNPRHGYRAKTPGQHDTLP